MRNSDGFKGAVRAFAKSKGVCWSRVLLRRWMWFLWALPVLGLLAQSVPSRAQGRVLTMEAEGDPAAGHVRLRWRGGAKGARYQLQQADDRRFRDAVTRYRGQQTAAVLSGLTNGERFYRVRTVGPEATPGPWSEVVAFKVAHHSRAMALAFLLAGAAIFAATLSFLLFFSTRVSHD